MHQKTTRLMKVLAVGLMGAALSTAQVSAAPDDDAPPAPMREYRSAWVATVANIDWPSKPGLSTEKQQEEAVKMLDVAKEMNLNNIVFQVRPHADALYASELEPWSYYLTGEQGKAPEPYYDPLEFWVNEAHKRGITLHVWFNPYRAWHTANKGKPAKDSLLNAHPEMVVELSNGMWWMDPAREDVQDHSYEVMLDVVKRYDIDGAHMDDYFYPYPSYNGGDDFPDGTSWEAYLADGGKLSRADWRRKAVDDFVERLYEGIKEERKEVQFGLSPFGIWRPGNPPSIAGLDQYNVLYADAKLWLNEGWVDYYTPQLYWAIAKIPQSFPVLLNWWKEQNTEDRNLWPGLGTHNVAGGSYDANEIVSQIMVIRGIVPEAPGHTHFSMKQLVNNVDGLKDDLMEGPYANQALIPPSPWLDDKAPEKPAVSMAKAGDGGMQATWDSDEAEDVFLWIVYTKTGGSWSHTILPMGNRSYVVPADTEKVAVSAVDRSGNESERAYPTMP